MMSWMKRLSLISSLGTDAMMVYEALSEKDAETAARSFVDFIAHIGRLLGVKELNEERVAKYRTSLAPIITDLLGDVVGQPS
jgi:hypothetical protein